MATDNKQLLAKVTKANIETTGDAPEPAKKKTLETALDSRERSFRDSLKGSGMEWDRFKRIIITEVAGNEDLMRIAVTNAASLLGACMEMAQLGLDPSIPNEVFLVPYGRECVCQTGYKGLAKLAMEAARDAGLPLMTLRADCVYQNDEYIREMGDMPAIRHRPPPFGEERGEVIGYVAVSRDQAGRINFREMTVEQVKSHKKRFSRSTKGPFADPENFDAYGLKTVLRQLINKDLPMGPKLARAIAMDPEIGDKDTLRRTTSLAVVLPEQDEHIDYDPATGEIVNDGPKTIEHQEREEVVLPAKDEGVPEEQQPIHGESSLIKRMKANSQKD